MLAAAWGRFCAMIARVESLVSRYAHLNWALADQAMVSGVNFLTGIMLARYLGLEEFGRFTLAWMAVLFVNSIQNAVIILPMMSIGPKQEPGDEPAYYGALAVQQIVFGAAAFVLVWGGAAAAAMLFPSWRIDGLALPLACAALAFQLQECMRRYFFTHGRGGTAFATDALRYLGQLAVLFWLFQETLMDSGSTMWVIAALATLAVLSAIPALGPVTWRREAFRATAERHWNFSKWLVGSALMQWTSGQLFFIAAGAMLGATSVGALRAAQTLMGVTNVLFKGLENVMPVRAAMHYQAGGKKTLVNYLWHVAVAGEFVTGAIAVTAAVAPEFWLNLVFGNEYREFGYLLQWFAAIQLLHYLTIPLHAGLRATEMTEVIFWASVGRTVFSLLAVYPLIKFLGVIGVMIGSAGLSLIGLVILCFFFLKWAYFPLAD